MRWYYGIDISTLLFVLSFICLSGDICKGSNGSFQYSIVGVSLADNGVSSLLPYASTLCEGSATRLAGTIISRPLGVVGENEPLP